MYNYYDEMYEDVKNAIEERAEELDGLDRDEREEKLNDDLWIDDSVTGNASGSYTFNRYTAEEYVKDNLDLLRDALNDFGDPKKDLERVFIDEDFEFADVSIRCYMLAGVISNVLDELEDAEEIEA